MAAHLAAVTRLPEQAFVEVFFRDFDRRIPLLAALPASFPPAGYSKLSEEGFFELSGLPVDRAEFGYAFVHGLDDGVEHLLVRRGDA